MAEYRVELSRRLLAAFPSIGIYLPITNRSMIYEPDYEVDLPSGLPNSDAETYGKSPFGSAYWDNIIVRTIPADPEEDAERYEFPNDPLVDCYLRKKITETDVYGGASVVEMSGLQGGEFRMRGVLWNNDGEFPEDQLSDLLTVFRQDAELEIISSRLFGMLNITSLVIESVGLPAIEGFSDSQPFVIQARETRSIELAIYE